MMVRQRTPDATESIQPWWLPWRRKTAKCIQAQPDKLCETKTCNGFEDDTHGFQLATGIQMHLIFLGACTIRSSLSSSHTDLRCMILQHHVSQVIRQHHFQ